MGTVTQKDIYGLVKSMVGPNDIKAINMTLVDFTGDWAPAILLSQLLYWTDKTRVQGGWIAKTYEEWFEEVRLSEYQVRKAAKLMEKDLLILETMVKKFNGNPTVHYRVKGEVFSVSFLKFLKERNLTNCTIQPEETSLTVVTEKTSGTITDLNTTENTHTQQGAPFDLFWDAYGKKEDRKKCEAKWGKLTAEQQLKALSHAPAYVLSTPEVRYRKNPLTYLNGECWEDEGPQLPAPSGPKLTTIEDYKSLWQ
jgi:hypothetical protein